MRVLLISTAVLAAGCASSGAKDESQPLTRACSVAECFLERDVRDFEVIDKTTVIVYVGAQRCPFQIDLRGFACDMSFAPTIAFRSGDATDSRSLTAGSGDTLIPRQPGNLQPITRSDIGDGRTRDLRVCSNDTRIGVDGGVFTEGVRSDQRASDRFDNPRSECQVDKIVSLTDDQLVELLVDRKGYAPPPPMGNGEIQVSKQQEEEGANRAASPAEPAAPGPAAPL